MYRWAEGQDDRLPSLRVSWSDLKPDVIVTTGTPGAVAAIQATKTIPIVMASSADPVGSGLVSSLARPRGTSPDLRSWGRSWKENGWSFFCKQSRALAPRRTLESKQSRHRILFRNGKNAGQALRISLDPVVEVRRADEFDNAFAAIANARPHALAVIADRFLLAHRKQIVEFAAVKRLPSMYPYREYVDAGGLMSYAPSNIELFRGAATYVDKILKGAKPGDLPIQEPTKFELVINLKTAKTLGLDVPQTVIARADKVIE